MSAGFVHEAALYAGADELLSIMVPFAERGAAAGEPVVFSLRDHNAALVRAALPDAGGVTFLPYAHSRPAATVRALLRLFEEHEADGGGRRLRVVGEVPDPSTLAWEPWARYEAAVNRLYAGYDVWAMCAYDTTVTPDAVLAGVTATHPRIATAGGGHGANDRYEAPEAFLAGRRPAPADPVERTPPALDLRDPLPATARRLVGELATSRTCLPRADVDDFIHGLNEAVTNAHVHGRTPVRLRAWASPDRLHATVSDTGAGPADPFAGLRPAPGRPNGDGGGMGLWMAHQLCGHVTHVHDADGFTIRLTAHA